MLEHWNQFPFFKWAGLEIQKAKEGNSQLILKIEDHHRGGGGTQAINGGILAYLFDGAMGTAVASIWPEGVIGQVTLSMNVQYLSMAQAQSQVIAQAQVVKKGKRTVFVDAQALDEQGTCCARCQGVFQLRYKA